MALRVLLADESSTIKKVFQLALQDFAVEVRPVNIGIDVASVASSFKPDIVFADVLLQKKNGYEVSAELKQNAELKGIPIVLMWSGFMEFDEDKFLASKANAQLEKPFDVAALRKLVTELVPRTKDQRLSQFLTFPQPPVEEARSTKAAPSPSPAPGASANQKYRLNLTPEELEPSHLPVDYEMPGEEADDFAIRENRKPVREKTSPGIDLDMTRGSSIAIDFTSIQAPPIPEQDVQFSQGTATGFRNPAPPPPPPPTAAPSSAATPVSSATAPAPLTALSEEQLEKIIRSQSAEVIESVVWKVIPEIATQIIERELNRLLKERDAF